MEEKIDKLISKYNLIILGYTNQTLEATSIDEQILVARMEELERVITDLKQFKEDGRKD